MSALPVDDARRNGCKFSVRGETLLLARGGRFELGLVASNALLSCETLAAGKSQGFFNWGLVPLSLGELTEKEGFFE